jgi:hypothetical protein
MDETKIRAELAETIAKDHSVGSDLPSTEGS